MDGKVEMQGVSVQEMLLATACVSCPNARAYGITTPNDLWTVRRS